MPIPSNTRTLRFVLLAFFSVIVLYKIFESGYYPKTHLPSVDSIAKEQAQNAKSGFEDTNLKELAQDIAKGPRAKAAFITLARNSDVWDIAKSIQQVEDRFNRRFHYDWVFLNDNPFDDQFKRVTSNLVSGKAFYGHIPKEHWSFPDWIDQERAAKTREIMREKKIIYGDSISYRHMCRFESGFFFRHELLKDYDYYWRVEPGIQLFCDINYDPFIFMKDHNKKYGFTLSLREYESTIETLWKTVKDFIKEHPEHIAKDNSMNFISEDNGHSYNLCHFWSNFEIGDLNFWRSKAYMDFFEHLDKAGGFFYERWGDAPVHSIAASLFLPKDQIHFFNDIAYRHNPFTHCPTTEEDRFKGRCSCTPSDNFDWKGYSCTSKFFEINGIAKPEGYQNQT
ncbi:nucleotide-diphospho-sugar transferase [Kalaharituber pfeilii]|nr:nucleotide-diphospho-sugar transferase [Kalaharituber pfeilii]